LVAPSYFATEAVKHGTVGIVADPHEIANVMGVKGINFMIKNGKNVPFHFFFAAPSCVPATPFESSGAIINADEIKKLLNKREIYALAEMMNFPGVINGDDEVMKKINAAIDKSKPIDGHAPLLSGNDLEKYVDAGISTDHECTNIDEAREKLKLGMKILIREGSAAKDFDALWPLLLENPDKLMFCTDDLHPDHFIKGHINKIVKKAIANGVDPITAIKVASLNAVMHYHLPVGLLRINDPADMIVIDNFENFNILKTFINGKLVYDNGKVNFEPQVKKLVNNFIINKIIVDDLKIKANTDKIQVIKALDGSLLTEKLLTNVSKDNDGFAIADQQRDILKIIVLNRYTKGAKPSIGFINGFNLKNCAIGSSVAHDSHNIVVVGTDDALILQVIELIQKNKGGIAFVSNDKSYILPLPIAGIMSNTEVSKAAKDYEILNNYAAEHGCQMLSPFMTLAFMSLLVIPHLKLSDLGLFDVDTFSFTTLFV
ncbi:MAG TPA: adenine deaminase, partial [Bacteroidales bacterium]|nr:adenine deaminase [Bacteroidales bacterium]